MTGIVVSNKMTKALVVEVEAIKVSAKYGKRYKTKKKYPTACADSSKFRIGDKVEIVACRPISKTIKFKVVE